MKQLTIVILLFFSVHLSAQIKYFTEVSGNLSLISNSTFTEIKKIKSDVQYYDLIASNKYQATYENKFGGGIAGGLQYFFSPGMSIEAGLDISAQRFSQELFHYYKKEYFLEANTSESQLVSNYHPAPTIEKTFSRNTHPVLLLSMPISVSYHTLENSLSAGVGFVPTSVITLEKSGTKSDNFNPLALGIQIHLRYRFSEKIWLTAALQEFTTGLYKREEKISISENRLLKIGLRYEL